MKTLKHCLAFFLPFISFASLAGCSSTPKEDVDVILISGQSNAVGCSFYKGFGGETRAEDLARYKAGYPDFKIAFESWTKNGKANDYTLQNSSNGKFINTFFGTGNSDLTFGMEIGMADYLSSKELKRKVFFIKYACGASCMMEDWVSPGSGANSYFYSHLVDYVKVQMDVLMEQGYQPHLKAMCWMQGEGDSYPGLAGSYFDETKAFVKDLRKAFIHYENEGEFAWIDGGISNSTEWVHYETINAAKEQFSELADNNIYIDTIKEGLDASTLQDDNAHYKAPYMIKLGNLFAKAVETFLSK